MTPTESTPGDVLADWLRARYRQTKTGQTDLVADAWRRDAREALSSLTDAGFTIRPEAGTVDATTLAAKAYQEGYARARNDEKRADALHDEVMAQVRNLESRLVAAAPDTGEDGV